MDGTFIITSLTAGVYTIEVEDSTGCTAVCEFTIIGNPPCELVIDQVIPQDATCPGINDGSITILASGSAPPFEYSIDGINYQVSNVFDMLAPGTYTVFVLDAMGCEETQDVVIGSGIGPELSILEIVNASCGVNNGSILVVASGGSAPYLYSIDGVNYGFSNLFPGLFADNYLVYVIDENGCMDSIPAIVEDSDAPVIVSIAVIDASCGLADGTITINAIGGLGVLLYSINGGSSFQSSSVFIGLSAGTYEIVVQDEAFCQVMGTATVQEIGGPVITNIAVVPTSCEESDGSITITATGVPVLQYSINGTQFQSSNIFQGLQAGNYTVTVRDGNGCVAVQQVTLNTTDGPQIQNVQQTHTTCGEDNGTILITASGGTGELTYFLNGDSFGDQNFIEDLPSGVYTIEVVDENGCSATEQVTINPSEGPDFDVYITPAHCGLPDGTIELDGVAGTPPFTYSINGGPFSANFTFVNLESEYYIMAIKDAKGCIYEQEVFLWEAPVPNIVDVITTNPDCGDVNGSIEVTATGNHLQYSINLPNFQQSPIFYPVPPGTYTVTIRDTFRCTESEVVVILPNPAPLINNVILTNPECGVSNGAIQVIASGGVAPLSYSLNSGPFGSSNTFTMLQAGVYMVTVRGANGCEDVENVILNVVGQEINNTSASICDGGQFILEGQVFTTAGNYSITLPGGAANGCDSLIILNLTVDTLPHKSLVASICQGDFYSIDGHNFNIGGHYLLDTIPGINGCDTIRTLDLTTTPLELKYLDIDLCIGDSFVIGQQVFILPGEYLLDTLSAQFGCDSVRILRLNINPLPIAGAGPDKILACLSPTAVLEGSITGGTPLWTGPGISKENQHELNPSVSIPGTYILTCITSAGCEHKDTVVVFADPALVIADAGIGDYFSCDIDTVILHAGPIGPDFHYQWAGPAINALNANQANPSITLPGMYTLVVTNTLNGCVSAPDTVIITDITNEIIAIVQDPNSLDCFSTFVDLNASGSSVGTNLIYIWFNAEGEIIGNTPLLEISSGGLFSFVVLDTISGCFDEDTVSVTDLISYPPVDAGDPQQLDCAHQTVILNEGAQNHLLNLVFQWTGPVGGILSPDTLLSIVVGVPGMYYLEAEDTITRCKNIDSVLVSDLSSMPIADIQVSETITCRDSLALLTIGWSTSGPDITYSWSGPGFNGVSTEFIEPSSVGLFTLTVFNTRNGCEAIDTVVIDWPPDLLDLEAIHQVPICEGDASGSISITGVSGGVPEYIYSINGQQGQSSPVFENLTAGVYTIAVTDGNGCTYTESVTINDGATLTIDIGIDIELELGDSITLGAEISLPWSQVDSLVWTPAEILSCSYCLDPVLYGLQSDVITATVYSGGCFAEDMLELRVDIDAEFFIPNVFSPNGDGANDFVTVFSDPRVKRVIRLEIFDRWGNLVFIGSDFLPNVPGLGWNGTFKNQPMNPAVFVYWAEVELINGDVRNRKGDITLLR
ncbi:MAG TPA: gliding motility-associated C-terminal domain-containing protein [Saprospiraceae bacterium]